MTPNFKAAARSAIRFALTSLALAQPVQSKPWTTVPTELRLPAQPLQMAVFMPQDDLGVGRDPADAHAVGGGLVGLLVDDALQSIVRGGAARRLASSRDALSNAGARQILMAAIRKSVGAVPWVTITEGGPLRDNSSAAKNALLDGATAPYVVAVDCSYSISQRFQAVYAYCSLEIASKAGNRKPGARWDAGNLLYAHSVEAEVALANPAASVGGRREQWTANSAALLQSGLERALDKAGMLVGRQLLLTSNDMEIAKSRPKERLVTAYIGMAYAHEGRLVEGADNILARVSPNPGGRMLVYKPGTDGIILLEKTGDLYYHYSIGER